MRATRLIGATLLLATGSVLTYNFALFWNGDSRAIDSNGSALGIFLLVAVVFGASRVADDDAWAERAGTALALAAGYFMVTWSMYGELMTGPDDAPHIVWFGLSVAAFSPAVVLIPASKWMWALYRQRSNIS